MKLRTKRAVFAVLPVVALLLMPVNPSPADSRNNVLTVGMGNEPFTLDPANGLAGTDYPILYSLFDRLVDFEPATLELKPGLATEWKFVGDDKLTFDMTIRDGVQFHDGTPLNAEAVRASLQYFKDSKRIDDLSVVTSIDVVGPNQVQLKLARQYSVLPAVLADRAGMIVSPTALAKLGKDFARNPVGAGPFMFKSWSSGTTLDLVKAPNYWDASKVKLNGIQYRFIPNPSSLASALISRQVDHAFRLDPNNFPALKATPHLRVATEPSTAYFQMSLNTSMSPLDNKLVRQAINMSIDRQALSDAVLGQGLSMPTLMPVPIGSHAHTPELQNSVKYDPVKAKALLAQAGYPGGVTIKICATPMAGYGTDITDIEQAQMKAAGITLDVTVMTGSACLQTFDSKKVFHAWQGSFSGRPDPYLTYAQNFGSTGQYNRGKINYSGVDALLEKLLTVYNWNDQKAIYAELNRKWIEDVPTILLFYRQNYVVYNKNLGGEEPNLQGKNNLVRMFYK